MLRTWHHCGRSDHYVTLVWSSDLKRSNGSEGTNTHTGFLRSLFAAGDKRWSVVRARACSREVSRGRFFCYRYLSESSTSFARKLFPTVGFALRGKSQIWCEFDCRDSMQFCCRFCICRKLWLLNTAIETWNLIDSRCEIFFRVSVSRYTNVVGNINVISWNLFRYISLLLFVALFFPWFLFFCFFAVFSATRSVDFCGLLTG
jgi:hypothetical protein